MEYIDKNWAWMPLEPWEHFAKMPYFIHDKYNIKKATIGEIAALFLYPNGELGRIEALKKQIARVQKAEILPMVVVLSSVSRYRRDALIEARIPFVIPGKQLYLPFLGTYLTERCDSEPVKLEKLQPAAQVLFFYYLYQQKPRVFISDAVKDLGYSAMTMSRAAKQLVQTDLFAESKDGVNKVLTGRLEGRELFEKMRPALINPVRRRTTIRKEQLTDEFILAGDSAVAKQTMINDSTFRCYAVTGKKLTELPYAMSAETDVAIKLWKYDPQLLSTNGIMDPLSLMMSFADEEDKRIQMAFEELLEQLREK